MKWKVIGLCTQGSQTIFGSRIIQSWITIKESSRLELRIRLMSLTSHNGLLWPNIPPNKPSQASTMDLNQVASEKPVSAHAYGHCPRVCIGERVLGDCTLCERHCSLCELLQQLWKCEMTVWDQLSTPTQAQKSTVSSSETIFVCIRKNKYLDSQCKSIRFQELMRCKSGEDLQDVSKSSDWDHTAHTCGKKKKLRIRAAFSRNSIVDRKFGL